MSSSTQILSSSQAFSQASSESHQSKSQFLNSSFLGTGDSSSRSSSILTQSSLNSSGFCGNNFFGSTFSGNSSSCWSCSTHHYLGGGGASTTANTYIFSTGGSVTGNLFPSVSLFSLFSSVDFLAAFACLFLSFGYILLDVTTIWTFSSSFSFLSALSSSSSCLALSIVHFIVALSQLVGELVVGLLSIFLSISLSVFLSAFFFLLDGINSSVLSFSNSLSISPPSSSSFDISSFDISSFDVLNSLFYSALYSLLLATVVEIICVALVCIRYSKLRFPKLLPFSRSGSFSSPLFSKSRSFSSFFSRSSSFVRSKSGRPFCRSFSLWSFLTGGVKS